ncbi:S-adenosyl-L-methionine-dependent methyltransferase [Actinoplanes ianthinogenes]|uniref:S-adenosyl-L-methionine-dependent methyltransferase n=1 Tax=Actinoplanes ianthinogenes TaxID=122358 RepID=A0ABM7LY45_9ACTN|nr:SAM-dependent methyltransferase [Actinoplanes ianthinogenes]BCJ44229.1 S-adenosyl-L-methionine-dependent methyltransferase [Actinoplanes ianthinogenes]GGQ96649.1 S-adenosyl-L-methionine-dependent methyltransferase [Actinoplanes ianthinogenes]
METGQASKTAYSAARYRAAHQVLEQGSIFRDPLALRVLGADAENLEQDAPRRGMRLFIAARHRFAEDHLAAAVGRGVRTVVVLGAGLDTFAYRNPHAGLEVIEIDHPDTQAWKRERLAQAGLAVPANLRYVGIDFEKQSLGDELELDGPAFFLWLGVVPYLSEEGFGETLKFVARESGSEVAFDYAQSPERMPAERRAALEARAARVAKLGEPWLTFFEPEEIAADLEKLGFGEIEDLGPSQLAARYFDRPDVPPETPGGHVLHARRV